MTGNLITNATIPQVRVQRCDGRIFIKMSKPVSFVKKPESGDIVIANEININKAVFSQYFADIVGKSVMAKLVRNFEVLFKVVPLSGLRKNLKPISQ